MTRPTPTVSPPVTITTSTQAPLRDTWKRLAVQSLTWRLGGIALSVALIWLATGSLLLGAEVGIAYNVIRYFTYMAHQAAWSRSDWLRKPR